VVDPPSLGTGHVTPLINAMAGFGGEGATSLAAAPPAYVTRLGMIAARA
jgi:hypothetical protein